MTKTGSFEITSMFYIFSRALKCYSALFIEEHRIILEDVYTSHHVYKRFSEKKMLYEKTLEKKYNS